MNKQQPSTPTVTNTTTVKETYGLTWVGKSEALAAVDSPSNAYLEEVPTLSVRSEQSPQNLFVEGDNLDALKILQRTHQNMVHAIYIDPPYNTGNDFVYQDNFRSGKVEYLALSGAVADSRTNESDGRLHCRWLSMMLPRLVLARNLLREDGVIFVSIDDNEIDKLRLLMSEVFGEKNFLAQIIIQSNPRGRQSEKHFATVHEYLLVFARNAESCKLSGAQLTGGQLDEFDRCQSDGRKYRLLGLRQRGSACLKEDRPNMHYPLYVDPLSAKVSLKKSARFCTEVLPMKSDGRAGRWMWGVERSARLQDLLEGKLIRHRNEWDVFVRDYLDDETGKVRTRKLKTIWDEKELNYQNGKRELKALFGEDLLDYPKPLALMEKIIALIGDPQALFLDFFAGSGTTAQAVLNANAADGGQRKFILVQIAEKTKRKPFSTIADICAERIRRSISLCQTRQVQVSAEKPAWTVSGFAYMRVVDQSADPE